MAFRKAAGKKAPERQPANYARRKAAQAQAEPQTDPMEEYQEEGFENQEGGPDDYQEPDQNQQAPQQTHYQQAPRQAPQQAPQQNWGQPQNPGYNAPRSSGNFQNRSNDGEQKSLRVTGFFPSKKGNCLNGRLRANEIEALKQLLEEAQASGQEVMFFLWQNQPAPNKPLMTITGTVAQPSQKGGWGNNFRQPQQNFNGGNFNQGGNFGGNYRR